MPARYGLDANQNGLVDLPNTFDYVHNVGVCPCTNDDCQNGQPQFRVYLDASPTRFPPIENAPVPHAQHSEDSPNGSRGYTPTDPALAYAQLRRNMRQLEWEVDEQAVTPEQLDWQWHYAICIPEGEHLVTLKAVDNYTAEWATYQRIITVEDLLIVTLGDSYGSGEGNPDRDYVAALSIDWNAVMRDSTHVPRNMLGVAGVSAITNDALHFVERRTHGVRSDNTHVRIAVWADDGQPPGVPTDKQFSLGTIDWSLDASGIMRRHRYDYHLSVSGIPDFDQFSQERREHDRSHRSTFAASSQAALELEHESDKYSVTFVNLAMTGAGIDDGILTNYNGAGTSRFVETADMKSQLLQLRSMIGRRKIDVLYLSVGGNEAGFANAIAGLLMRDGLTRYVVSEEMVLEGVKTGHWQDVENSAVFFSWFVSWTEKKGRDRLLAAYDELAENLRNNQFEIGQIAISEYPDFTARFGSDGSLYWCGELLGDIKTTFEIDLDEIQWAYNALLVPLNDVIWQGAQAQGWTYVSGIASRTDGHGLCAFQPYEFDGYDPVHPVPDRLAESIRWFRTARESEVVELDGAPDKTMGTAHPNEFGHKAISLSLLSAFKRPTIIDHVPSWKDRLREALRDLVGF